MLDNGRITFDRSDTGVVFAGDISGSGSINILRGGMIFTGTNTYAGTTDIGTANLTLGDGSTAGTITSDVTLVVGSSTLAFDEPTAVTYGGNIVGVGKVVVDGPGMITLTNTSNAYFGGTTVSGGRLNISSDAVLGDASGALTLDDGTLQFDATVHSGRNITLGSGGGTVDINGYSSILSGTISGDGMGMPTSISVPTPVSASLTLGYDGAVSDRSWDHGVIARLNWSL